MISLTFFHNFIQGLVWSDLGAQSATAGGASIFSGELAVVAYTAMKAAQLVGLIAGFAWWIIGVENDYNDTDDVVNWPSWLHL